MSKHSYHNNPHSRKNQSSSANNQDVQLVREKLLETKEARGVDVASTNSIQVHESDIVIISMVHLDEKETSYSHDRLMRMLIGLLRITSDSANNFGGASG